MGQIRRSTPAAIQKLNADDTRLHGAAGN